MKDRLAALFLNGVVNEGELNVHPSGGFLGRSADVAMPASTNLFRNVDLTEELRMNCWARSTPCSRGRAGSTAASTCR